jgi:RecA-family ATPase
VDNTQDSNEFPSISPFRPSALLKREVKERRDVVADRLPRGKVVLLAGEGGIGKSSVLIDLFVAVSRGNGKVFGSQVMGGPQPCVLVLGEDDADTVARRLQGMQADDLIDAGAIFTLPDFGAHQLFERDGYSEVIRPTRFYEWLDNILFNEKVVNGGLGFLGLDPFSALFGVDENKPKEVQACWTNLAHLAVKHDVCIVVTHHLRKDSSGSRSDIRGSTALVDGVRAAYVMTKEQDPASALREAGLPEGSGIDVLKLKLVKDNLGLHRGHVTLMRTSSGLLQDITEKVSEWMKPDDALISVIKAANEAGRRITKTGTRGLYGSSTGTWPASIRDLSKRKLTELANSLVESGRVVLDKDSSLRVPGVGQ